MRISDWSSDVCSSDLVPLGLAALRADVVGTQMLLWRLERAVPVLVEGDAPVVQAAEVEPFHRRVAAVALVRGQPAGGHVHPHHAVWRDVPLRPVVVLLVPASGNPPARHPAPRVALPPPPCA